MRKINTADIFTAARAIKTSGLRAELKSYALKIANGKKDLDVKDIGVDTVLRVIELFSDRKAESAVYEVLAGPFEIAAEKVPELPLGELVQLLQELAKDEGLPDFFSALSDILKKN